MVGHSSNTPSVLQQAVNAPKGQSTYIAKDRALEEKVLCQKLNTPVLAWHHSNFPYLSGSISNNSFNVFVQFSHLYKGDSM